MITNHCRNVLSNQYQHYIAIIGGIHLATPVLSIIEFAFSKMSH
jgi:hypothetical protein